MDDRQQPAEPRALYEALVERLDADLFEITTEPTGWICKQCQGRFSRADPTPPPRWALQQLVDSIADAAHSHLRSDHPPHLVN